MQTLIKKLTVNLENLTIEFKENGIKKLVKKHMNIKVPNAPDKPEPLVIKYEMHKEKRGAIIIKPKDTRTDPLDLPADDLKKLAQGIVWREEHFDGTMPANCGPKRRIY